MVIEYLPLFHLICWLIYSSHLSPFQTCLDTFIKGRNPRIILMCHIRRGRAAEPCCTWLYLLYLAMFAL